MLKPLFTWRSALLSSDLPSTTRLVALALSTYMSERGDSCFPGLERLASDCNIDKSSVIRHLRVLIEGGWLDKRQNRGRGNRSEYQATIPDKMMHERIISKNGKCRAGASESGNKMMHQCGQNDAPVHPEKDASISRTHQELITDVFLHWQNESKRPRTQLTSKRREKIKKRLEHFTPAELKQAITIACHDSFYLGKNDRNTRYDWIETILRNDERVEQFLDRRNGNGRGPQYEDRHAIDLVPVERKSLSPTIGELFGEMSGKGDRIQEQRL